MNKWKYAHCMHPMYLIIKEDNECLERKPPWGESTLPDYIGRLDRNVKAIERSQDVILNLDISAVELLDLKEQAPEIVERIATLARGGRLGLVNGTYSQPPLQILGPESNLRQFLAGRKVFEEMLGCQIDTYLNWDAQGIHEQMPQILTALGYRFAIPGGYYATIVFMSPHELIADNYKMDTVEHEEFTRWVGIDGTTIVTYLPGCPPCLDPWKPWKEIQKDLIRCPPIHVDVQDMISIDAQWLEGKRSLYDFVKLDSALSERVSAVPPRSTARLFTYWSHAEGVAGEALSRLIRRAEITVKQAESVALMRSMLLGGHAARFDDIWIKILKAQHHDVFWAGAPELRAKGLRWLDQAITESQEQSRRDAVHVSGCVNTRSVHDGKPTIVINPYPRPSNDMVEVALPAEEGSMSAAKVLMDGSREVPSQLVPAAVRQDGSIGAGKICFRASVPAFGYRTFSITPTASGTIPRYSTDKVVRFENHWYSASIRPDGLVESLREKRTGSELLDGSRVLGNEVRARHEDTEAWITTRNDSARADVTSGPLFTEIEYHGSFSRSTYTSRIRCYRHLPRIEFELQFDFAGESYGSFIEDESKLNVYWPLSFAGSIHHDIPFGAVEGREHRPLLVINWLDLHDDKHGFAYINQGTPKHWVRDNTIANVLAWSGTKVTSRDWPTSVWFPKEFDLRLRGRHTFQYAVLPHAGNWVKGNVPEEARRYLEPLLAVSTDTHAGRLPSSQGLVEIRAPSALVTAMYRSGNEMVIRFHEAWGRRTRVRLRMVRSLREHRMESLARKALRWLAPFQIGQWSSRLAEKEDAN